MLGWIRRALGGVKTALSYGLPTWGSSAGERVTHDSAKSISAYYAAIRNISEDIGKIPTRLYRLTEDGREVAKGDPVHEMISLRPNPYISAMTFWETIVSWAMGWGNGYAEIVRDMRGRPMSMHLIHPSRVDVISVDGKPAYRIYPESGTDQPTQLSYNDVYHLHGLGTGLAGDSVLEHASESLGICLAAQKFGGSFFGNGANVGGMLTHPTTLSEEARGALVESMGQYRGSKNSNKMLLLEEGMKFEKTTVNPKDAQALELRAFQVEEIARWFRVPPHKIGDLSKATYSNIEQQNIDYVTDALMSWTTRIEQECQLKLVQADGYEVDFDFKWLLRGDQATRAEYYQKMAFIGTMSRNEIRSSEGLNSIGPAGNRYYVQSSMVDAETLGQGQQADAKTTAAKADFAPIIHHACSIVATKEWRATSAERAKQRDHSDFVETFWAEQMDYAWRQLAPIAETMGRLGLVDPSQKLVALHQALAAHYESRELTPSTTTELTEVFSR